MRWALGLLLVSSAAQGQPAPREQVQELRLANGMVWLIVERHDAPVFTGYVRVRVGGADEEPGITGLAHLFEHMAFKGTPRLGAKDWAAEQQVLPELEQAGDALAALRRAGKQDTAEARALASRFSALEKKHAALFDENALARLYQVNGGVGLNATTDKDLTSYFVSLPKNRPRPARLLHGALGGAGGAPAQHRDQPGRPHVRGADAAGLRHQPLPLADGGLRRRSRLHVPRRRARLLRPALRRVERRGLRGG
jgi:hypothetical protein